jgi:hypothetical protein
MVKFLAHVWPVGFKRIGGVVGGSLAGRREEVEKRWGDTTVDVCGASQSSGLRMLKLENLNNWSVTSSSFKLGKTLPFFRMENFP